MHKKNFIYGILLALTLIFCVVGYLEFNKPAQIDISETEAIKDLQADDLIVFFQDNEPNADSTYVNKIISVTGVIKDISYINKRHTIILESNTFNENFVMCDMAPLAISKTNTLATGDTVTLKGVCKGYLLDVIMLNCTPINEKSKK